LKVKVFLHGYLASFHEGPITLDAETPAKAVEHVTRLLPQFQPRLIEGPHRIEVIGHRSIESLMAPLEVDELHIIPQFSVGKNGGYVQIAVGAALVAAGIAAYFIPGGGVIAPFLISLGGGMIIGGIQAYLAPSPSSDDKTEKSRYLGAPGNTLEIGTRIPILYGEYKVSGHFLSFDITALNKAVTE
jgi:predicted phage tail protein